jgi:hypothetical protein
MLRHLANRFGGTRRPPVDTTSYEEGFACRCSEAERTASQARLEWAYELLGITTADWFISGAVMELDLRYDISIVGMYASQWYGLDFRPSFTEPNKPASEGRIQCDRIEDGVAMLLKKAFDTWGEYRPGSDRAEDPEDGMRWRNPDAPVSFSSAE